MGQSIQLDRYEIRLSGLGGQGILTLGKILGSALALDHGYYVTQTQSYGPEARGGASRSDLVISSESISFPKPVNLDLLVALSQEACNMYFRNLKTGGVLLVDTFMVKTTPTNRFKGLPFTQLAKEKIGVIQTTNVIVLGALSCLLPFARQNTMKRSLERNLPEKLVDMNLKAFSLGHREAKKAYPEVIKG